MNLGNGKIYMFNGSNYIRYDILQDKVDQGIKPISSNWEGFPPSWTRIDAAVNWGNGKAYMFNGGEYIRFDILQDKVDQGIKPIKGNWSGFPNNWSRVDAVLNWGDDRVYMFNGDMYLRYSVSRDKVEVGPRPIKDHWPGFPAGWNKIDDGVIIDRTAEKMGSLIEHGIQTETVGFAYVIYDNKRLVKSGYGGYRAKPDGQNLLLLPFSPNTEIGIGSITKSLTTMALLKSLNDKSIVAADKAAFSVDASINPHLPQVWFRHPSISTVTFRQLLTHTSGIQKNDDDYATLKSIMLAGVGQKPYEYANPNFSLMRVLIPAINGSPILGLDAADALTVALAYKLYLQENVFQPSGVRNADCLLNSPERALLYGPPSDNSGSYPYDGDDDSTFIAGAGGWKLSALELARVINTFFTTERILPVHLRDQMMNEELGCYNDSGCVKATHNGAWASPEGKGYHNCYYIFNDGIQCVLMTNSTYKGNPTDPESVVRAAHKDAFGCHPTK